MAEGAWVPAFDTIWTSPKTRRLALDLKVTRYHAAGIFLHLMAWMRDNVESGDLGPVDRASIARAIGLADDSSREDTASSRGEAFFRALVAARFISDDLAGHVKGWEEGPGRLVKSRRSDRLRKEHQRRSHNVTVADCPLCLKLSDGQGSGKPMTTASRSSQGRDLSAGQTPPVRQTSGAHNTTEQTQQPHSPTAGAGHGGTAGGNGALDRPSSLTIIQGATGLWRDVLEQLAKGMAEGTFVSWFDRTRLEVDGDRYSITAPNAFALEWMKTRFGLDVRKAIASVTSKDPQTLEIIFRLEGGPREPDVIELDR